MSAAGPRPKVSVVIATFNGLRLLRRTLASVYAQTFRDFEVVLVDDASSDGTSEWLGSRAFPALTVLRNARNLGPSGSRNRAVRRSRGEIIAFLDHDDLWRPDYLATMVKAFRRPGAMFACSDNDVIDGQGRVTLRRAMRRDAFRQPAFAALSSLERVPAFSATMIRRAAWAKVGGFDERFRLFCDDSDFAFRIGLAYGPGAFEFVDRSLVSRRVRRRRGVQISSLCDLSVPGLLSAFRSRPGRAGAGRRDVVFDILLQNSKHRWWVDRLLHG